MNIRRFICLLLILVFSLESSIACSEQTKEFVTEYEKSLVETFEVLKENNYSFTAEINEDFIEKAVIISIASIAIGGISFYVKKLRDKRAANLKTNKGWEKYSIGISNYAQDWMNIEKGNRTLSEETRKLYYSLINLSPEMKEKAEDIAKKYYKAAFEHNISQNIIENGDSKNELTKYRKGIKGELKEVAQGFLKEKKEIVDSLHAILSNPQNKEVITQLGIPLETHFTKIQEMQKTLNNVDFLSVENSSKLKNTIDEIQFLEKALLHIKPKAGGTQLGRILKKGSSKVLLALTGATVLITANSAKAMAKEGSEENSLEYNLINNAERYYSLDEDSRCSFLESNPDFYSQKVIEKSQMDDYLVFFQKSYPQTEVSNFQENKKEKTFKQVFGKSKGEEL